jgi:hypothetical protein
MFDFFRRRTAKELIEQANETYGLPTPVKVPTMPQTPPRPAPKKQVKELYRIGVNNDGQTTLTLMEEYGTSLTLIMDQPGFEQMIRMIRATYSRDK